MTRTDLTGRAGGGDGLTERHRGIVDDAGGGDAACVAVAEAVAAEAGVDPLELDPPLGRVVPADALDALVSHSGSHDSDLTLQFTYCGYTVTVSSDGTVDVSE